MGYTGQNPYIRPNLQSCEAAARSCQDDDDARATPKCSRCRCIVNGSTGGLHPALRLAHVRPVVQTRMRRLASRSIPRPARDVRKQASASSQGRPGQAASGCRTDATGREDAKPERMSSVASHCGAPVQLHLHNLEAQVGVGKQRAPVPQQRLRRKQCTETKQTIQRGQCNALKPHPTS